MSTRSRCLLLSVLSVGIHAVDEEEQVVHRQLPRGEERALRTPLLVFIFLFIVWLLRERQKQRLKFLRESALKEGADEFV